MALAQTRRLGIFLVLVSAVLWSTAGLFVRMADLDIWSVVAWRSLFAALVLGGYAIMRDRVTPSDRPRRFGLPGIAATALSAAASISYIAALTWTSVANVMTVYAALPFIATLIAFVWLGERVTPRFVIAGLVAVAGICITVGAAFARHDLLGILAAVAMTTGFAAQLVIAKRYPALDTARMTALSATVCAVLALPFMHMTVPEGHALLACALYGVVSTGISYVMVLVGSRMIGAGEAGLLSLLDVVLGPLWVWLFYDEKVGPATLVGATAVLLAVIWYLSDGLRFPARRRPDMEAALD